MLAVGAVASTGPPPAPQARRASHRLLARPQALPVAIQWPVVRRVLSSLLTSTYIKVTFPIIISCVCTHYLRFSLGELARGGATLGFARTINLTNKDRTARNGTTLSATSLQRTGAAQLDVR